MLDDVFVFRAFFQANLFNHAIADQRPINLCGLVFPSLINLSVAKLPFALSKKPTRPFDDRTEQPSKNAVNPLVHRLSPRGRARLRLMCQGDACLSSPRNKVYFQIQHVSRAAARLRTPIWHSYLTSAKSAPIEEGRHSFCGLETDRFAHPKQK
jgi:hypothetical protein